MQCDEPKLAAVGRVLPDTTGDRHPPGRELEVDPDALIAQMAAGRDERTD